MWWPSLSHDLRLFFLSLGLRCGVRLELELELLMVMEGG